MDAWLEALILGIVQGLTEFLPVSSSGHLEIAKFLLGYDAIPEESMLLTVTTHAATALATIWIFRKDVSEIIKGLFKGPSDPAWNFSMMIVISMIPAALVGILLEDRIEELFANAIPLVSAMLLITGILLWVADTKKGGDKKISIFESFIIGLAQAFAILPGISRSGATISTALLLGNDRELTARFSFLMAYIFFIFGASKLCTVHIDPETQKSPCMLMAVTILCIAVIIYYIGDAALL